MRGQLLYIIISISLFFRCHEVVEINTDYSGLVFSLIDSKSSGIDFVNEVTETTNINILTYDYFYNGGGVAIGDINNDGLSDIYFSSNNNKNGLFLNRGNLQFEDITHTASVAGKPGWKTGVTMVDINADGYLDIYVCRSGKFETDVRKNELFINNGDLTFTEKAASYGIDDPGYSTQAAFFDYDNDGDLDMYLLNHNVDREQNIIVGRNKRNPFVSDKLYEFDNGKYTDVTQAAGLITNNIGYGLGISTGDLNNDGYTDIYVTNDYLEQDYLYYNNRNKTFREVIKEKTNHTSVFSMGCDFGDINNDGRLDIVTADMVAEDNYRQKTNMASMNPDQFHMVVNNGFHHQYMINTLQLNNGNSFSEIGQLAGISNTDWSWSTLFADYDNDGFKDLLITNGYRKESANKDFIKYHEKKIKTIGIDHSREEVLDGLLKKIPSTKIPNYIFKNTGNLVFEKKSTEWGMNQPSFSNGAAYADLDNDGDLEIVINNIDEEAFLYKNLSSENHIGNFIQIKLKGPKNNPSGIGAKIILNQGLNMIYHEHYTTHGYQSAVEDKITLGVGSWYEISELKVVWPGNYVQTLSDVDVNQLLSIEYDDAKYVKPDYSFPSPLFIERKNALNVDFVHVENEFDDFKQEILLPHKMSNFGPTVAVGDVNGDGKQDFFVGGAANLHGAFYVQKEGGKFEYVLSEIIESDARYEDMGTALFDFDNDGDLDLYVVSGGSEMKDGDSYYQDRLYRNDGKGVFSKTSNILPAITTSGSKVVITDFNNDGFKDLLVCGRLSPGKYPMSGRSQLFQNHGGKKFLDVTTNIIPDLIGVGMITDATFFDSDGDQDLDLVVVGEWMSPVLFEFEEGIFKKTAVLNNETGWWFSVAAYDFNNDGMQDLIGGNLGLNYKYKASDTEPFEIYVHDFDDSGSLDIVLGYYNSGELFPLRGRQCSSQQMPFISDKYKSYDEFGSATLRSIYGKDLNHALHYKATTFASKIFFKTESGYDTKQLPLEAQFSSINSILIGDYNNDKNPDILIAGNLFASEVETPRNDAGHGFLLLGDGLGNFEVMDAMQSGLNLMGDVKDMKLIHLNNERVGLLVANNNGPMQLLEVNVISPFWKK